jgi:ribose-phosphate pyrophosphokinase
MNDFLVIGNVSDDPFAIDIGHLCGQVNDMSDLISLKSFANSEFCPRFISDEHDFTMIGRSLSGRTVIICSTSTHTFHTRQALAMRTFILARAAKDNGAHRVILVEPDLFYSAQDRGPHLDEGEPEGARSLEDMKKFDGQPLTSQLYALLLRTSGVDAVVTIHNHSEKVQRAFARVFNQAFYNLIPNEVYAKYIKDSDMLVSGEKGEQLVLCAPDEGAVPFVHQVFDSLGLSAARCLVMEKERQGERQVSMTVSPTSDITLSELAGKDVIVLDDMVRTGSTIVECCRHLRTGKPRRVCFGLTHFYASDECRENLNSKFIDEILTLNTIPSILNRDTQGRLRKKIVVLKIEKWIARFLLQHLGKDASRFESDFYAVDMSSKNPRWPSLSRV